VLQIFTCFVGQNITDLRGKQLDYLEDTMERMQIDEEVIHYVPSTSGYYTEKEHDVEDFLAKYFENGFIPKGSIIFSDNGNSFNDIKLVRLFDRSTIHSFTNILTSPKLLRYQSILQFRTNIFLPMMKEFTATLKRRGVVSFFSKK
jgi:hypothetical protein